MADDFNPILKENYGSVASRIRAKRKKRASFAEGGFVPSDPADMDPQSAAAAPGVAQVGQAVMQSEPVQNVITGKSQYDYQNKLNDAIAGDPVAQKAVVDESLATAMGTLKELPKNIKLSHVREIDPETGKEVLQIFAKNEKGHTVASSDLSIADDGQLRPESTYVWKNYRGQGLASNIYKHAQDITAMKLMPGEEQSEGAKALWKSTQGDLSEAYGQVDKGLAEKPLRRVRTPSAAEQEIAATALANRAKRGGSNQEFADGGEVDSQIANGESGQISGNSVPINANSVLNDSNSVLNDSNSVPNSVQNVPNSVQNVPIAAETASHPEFISDDEFTKMAERQPMVDNSAQSQTQPDFIPDDQFKSDEDIYGTVKQQVIAAAEGAAQGVAGPLAPMVEKAMGVSPEAIRMRAENNPWIHGGSEALGFTGSMLTGVGEGTLLAKAGEVAAQGFKGASFFSKLGASGSRAATEMALMQTGDEITKMVVNDPAQSVQTAITNVGLSGLLGGVGGATLGAVGGLWKATVGDKAGQMVADFKSRINEHLTNPDPLTNVTEELSNHYKSIKAVSDDVYGTQGLKAQDIAKAMPEMSVKISDQASRIGSEVHEVVQKMMKKPNIYPERLTSKLQGDLDTYIEAIGKHDADPATIFNAAQDLKQTVQGYSKFDKFVKPVDEAYDFVKDVKKLGYSMRESLEDSAVWGKAADRQKAINKAFTEFRPALEDFEKKFTSEVGGERVIDSGKINTYMNQVGKPNAEIKQSMLKKFLESSDKYRKVINETHANLGIESPLEPQSLNAVMNTLKEQTDGGKLADIFIRKGLADVAGKGLGATIGGTLGHTVGAGGIGTLVGEHALGPFISSMLPAIVKPMLKEASNANAMKAAAEYGASLVKGEALISKAAKNIFKTDAEVISASMIPSEKDRQRLSNRIGQLNADPTRIASEQANNKLSHYLPGHDQAASQTAMGAVNYISKLKSYQDKKAPLDRIMPASAMEKAVLNKALDIAQQPLTVLRSLKNGTLTNEEVSSLAHMYPNLYDKLQQKVMNEMITHISKGETIPYSTRMGLSLFLRQSLDSTMTPAAIMSAQPQGPQGPQDPGQSSPKVQRSTAKVGDKSNRMALTANQSAEQDHQKR